MTIERGIGIAKFEGFRNWVKENPDKGILGLESTVVYVGTVGRSIAHIGPYQLTTRSLTGRRGGTPYRTEPGRRSWRRVA